MLRTRGSLLAPLLLLSACRCDAEPPRDNGRAAAASAATPGPAASERAEVVPASSSAPSVEAPPALDGGRPAPDPQGLRACCEAIHANALAAPPPPPAPRRAAAAQCDEAAAAGLGRTSLAAVRSTLKNVGFPAACR